MKQNLTHLFVTDIIGTARLQKEDEYKAKWLHYVRGAVQKFVVPRDIVGGAVSI